ncbi:hypothetical protein DEG02_020690 [Xanthomonas vasicola]|nr:hypothetical protein KWO_002285 [Xanthomonas vasicola pv. musacearum NCPPB 4379]RJL80729.1 hypothetical protein DEG03_021380 [Xanthomonas vasicola]RRJ35867.1 hypothetical protein EIM46_20930 [Xanthomonas vasicola pv. musacearum]RJL82098.1 hypothetical protein DEF98_020750 [Xanthomonas vasicola]RJL84514.1 hypothetical protein DEF95_021295 [Xanthomonas vasicola]
MTTLLARSHRWIKRKRLLHVGRSLRLPSGGDIPTTPKLAEGREFRSHYRPARPCDVDAVGFVADLGKL